MLKWIIDNKEWVFSGFGVVIGTTLISFVLRKYSDDKKNYEYSQGSGDNSINIQGIKAKKNVEININKEEKKDVE